MAENPKRVQLKRTKGWRMPPNTVKVDRSTRWGNPFVVTEDRPADSVALAYRTWLTVEGCHAGMPERKTKLLDAMRDLRGKNLACWCPLEDADGNRVPCHADVLLELANDD